MKKIFSVILAILIVICTATATVAADSVEIEFGELVRLPIGDTDADLKISASDLATLKKALLTEISIVRPDTADINYDGKINVIDLVRLKKKIAGKQLESLFATEALTLKNKILSASDTLPTAVTGTIYHIAEDGSSTASGTEANPLSFSALTEGKISLSAGDAVLFKRGDTFRGSIKPVSGVYYGAYGEGSKPNIYGSAKNYATASFSNNDGIYSISGFGKDVGMISLDNDKYIGFKKSSLSDVKADYDFYYDSSADKLSVKLPRAPKNYSDIEIGTKVNIVNFPQNISDVTIENLCLKYTGAHAVSVGSGSNNVKIKNCEIGYIGGSYLSGSLRYGNGIEFWCACTDVTAENNWIYQIYDSGITHQGGGEYLAKNIRFVSNLIEYCGMGSIEYWLSFGADSNGSYNLMSRAENVVYQRNIMRFAGYGWGGEQRPDKCGAHIRSDVTCPNWFTDFTVTGNIFDTSAVNLLEIGGSYATYPTMRGNTYAQITGGKLGTFGEAVGLTYDLYAKENIIERFTDSNAKVYWY